MITSNKSLNKNRKLRCFMNDSIGDMLTRIRNACLVKKTSVIIPHTKTNLEITKKLEKEGFIQGFIQDNIYSKTKKNILIRLKYYNKKGSNTKESCITNLQRISKPGLRIYVKVNKIPRVLSGTGILIVSTKAGLLTDREARLIGVGGELVCSVW